MKGSGGKYKGIERQIMKGRLQENKRESSIKRNERKMPENGRKMRGKREFEGNRQRCDAMKGNERKIGP